MNKKPETLDVICIGDTAIDDYYLVQKLPQADEKVHARYTNRSLGGTTSNTARALHQMGASVLFLTKTGRDAHGKFIEDHFSEIGLKSRFLHCEQTPIAQILVAKDGEKAILLHGFDSRPDWKPSELDEFLKPTPARVVFSTLSLPVNDFLPAFNANLVISLEPAILSWDPQLFAWSAQHSHTLIIDRHTFSLHFNAEPNERSLHDFFLKGNYPLKFLIVTLGAQGCMGIDRDSKKAIHIPAFNIKAIDTTGAGDLFNAAFIYSFFVKGAQFKESLQYANAIAAASCEKMGTDLTPEILEAGEILFSQIVR